MSAHPEYKNRIDESHPELDFARLNGSVLLTRKKEAETRGEERTYGREDQTDYAGSDEGCCQILIIWRGKCECEMINSTV